MNCNKGLNSELFHVLDLILNTNIYYSGNKLHLLWRKHMTFPGFRNTLDIFVVQRQTGYAIFSIKSISYSGDFKPVSSLDKTAKFAHVS